MTQHRPTIVDNPAAGRTVLRLQRARAMRFVLTVTLLLAGASNARAQSCTNVDGNMSNNPSADFTLAVQENGVGDATPITISPTVIGKVLDIAECECDSQDLYLRARVTRGFSVTPSPPYSVWAGNTCTAPTNRTTQCEQITTQDVNADAASEDSFRQGNTGGPPVQRVPVRALVAPNASSGSTTAHQCVMGQVQNSVWFLFGDPNNPDSCVVPLNYYGTPPPAPTGLKAGSGDQAVTLTWNPPPTGTNNAAAQYQVLCADENFRPIAGAGAYSFGQTVSGYKLGFSTCVDPLKHQIQRRVLANAGTVEPSDGGTVPLSSDMAMSPPLPAPQPGLRATDDPLHPEDSPLDGGTASNCNTSDAGAGSVFAKLDKSFVCTDPTDSSTTSVRITNLQNKHVYYFAVVAIDGYGNPAASPTVCAQPQPVEDLYRRFLDDGGKPQGFCFIATAAYGSYEHPFVMALRDFRDRVLLPSDGGARFVAWYYRVSPPAADWIRQRAWARFAVRVALWPLIAAAVVWLEITPVVMVLLGGLLFALAWSRLRRRRVLRVAAPLHPARSEA